MSVSVTLAPLVRKGPPEGVLRAGSGLDRGKVLVPRLRGSQGPLVILYPGGGGVGVDPLVSAHHLLPSLLPSLRGKGACSSGKTPEQKLLRLILRPPFPPPACVDRGMCLRARRVTAPGQPPPPRLPRSYNLSGAEAEAKD